MQFHVTINTTRAASISTTHGLPARANKLDTEFELPIAWGRKECVEALAEYFRNIEVLPYLNLAAYEHAAIDVKTALGEVGNVLMNHDHLEPVSIFRHAPAGDNGGSVTVTIREISYI